MTRVADGLTPLLKKIDELVPLPGNPRHGDVGAISESLKRFGQLKPIVVNTDGIILAGNHTYQAAIALGWTEVAAVVVDLEGEDQPAFALADNRLSDLADYDNEALLAMLSQLSNLDGTGYDFDDIDLIRADLEAPLRFPVEDVDDQTRLDQITACHSPACQHVC